jgi:hypothetical protein
MTKILYSSMLGYLGVLGGVAIALGLPWIVLAYGADLSSAVRTTLIILGLVGGVILACASAVVGITIPTAIHGGKLDIERIAGGGACCPNDKNVTRENEAEDSETDHN